MTVYCIYGSYISNQAPACCMRLYYFRWQLTIARCLYACVCVLLKTVLVLRRNCNMASTVTQHDVASQLYMPSKSHVLTLKG